MRGKHHIIVQNNRIRFEFDIKRNITVVKGNSATGKTTLIDMILAYAIDRESSGVDIDADTKLLVLDALNWKSIIKENHNCIFFMDEWIEQSLVKEMINDVDSSRVIAASTLAN